MNDDIKRLEVISGGGKRPQDVTGELAERIKDLIYEYDGRILLSAAIGTLEIVKIELLQDQSD